MLLPKRSLVENIPNTILNDAEKNAGPDVGTVLTARFRKGEAVRVWKRSLGLRT